MSNLNPTRNLQDWLDEQAGEVPTFGTPEYKEWAAKVAERAALRDPRPIMFVDDERFDFEDASVSPERTTGGAGHPLRRNQFGDANVPTDKQKKFFESLLVRKLGHDQALVDGKQFLAEKQEGWTKKNMSRHIDALLAMPNFVPADHDDKPAPTNIRKNSYAGKCTKCGGWVEAEAGVLVKDANGKWAADHVVCPKASEVRTVGLKSDDRAETPEGMHRVEDGRIFKVQLAVHGSGLPYAKQLVTREDENGTIHAEFVYAQGAINMLSAATLMTLDEARAYGALYGVCCNCAATLTDEDSIRLGIGPVCGQRVMEWATGVQMTKAQMVLLGRLEDGPQTPTGLAKRTAQALADFGLARFDGTTLTKI